ncbi:hypothetical protein AJ79_09553 [Helicocarpus griseus UAMH5409]|uniref:Major facilitator superfamily (MFS) profile domain-containing protein n=1 Tax=Helicocarpus griseus UAMH5409 TaxID=1447875 RepID=A0A2B7WIG6_9EURO|nr:hypothetical protein AJ79_09553 [Helicocarpus griseus UAMH5409]
MATTADFTDEYTAEEERKVIRKLDVRLMPILALTYMLQYLDKGNINFAPVFGLEEGTNLKEQDYSWLTTWWSILCELCVAKTANWKIYCIGDPKRFDSVGRDSPAWNNFTGMAANRFMLGLTEVVVNPGFVLVMGIWYTIDEKPFRLEIYYCMKGIGTMFGGCVY